MKIKIIFVVISIVFFGFGALTGGKIQKKADKETLSVVRNLYEKRRQEDRADFNALANKARITIQNKYDKLKNKNGNMYFVPSSSIEIDKLVDSINEKVATPIDSLQEEAIKPETFWEKIKFW